MGGTRTSDLPPWMTYANSFEDKSISKELQSQIDEYSKRRHEKSSNQNIEEYHRQKEYSDGISKQYQFLNPDEYKDNRCRIGKIMHSSEFINKLHKIGLKCWYRPHPQQGKATLVVQRGYGMLPLEVGCWVQQGFMQEFSLVEFDDHGIPLAEKRRGWRTCCLQLIIKGLITEEKVNKVFGNATGPASKRYNSTLYGFKNEYKK